MKKTFDLTLLLLLLLTLITIILHKVTDSHTLNIVEKSLIYFFAYLPTAIVALTQYKNINKEDLLSTIGILALSIFLSVGVQYTVCMKNIYNFAEYKPVNWILQISYWIIVLFMTRDFLIFQHNENANKTTNK